MKTPEALQPLIDQGILQQVLRPLMAGKEAQVFLVMSQGEKRIAKVYKEADHRSFKHRADYTEGRRVRNSRQARAMAKRSKFGRAQVEDAWRTAEVDAIYKLAAAGVRVPHPYDFVDGVLVMELISGPDGEPAPRLVDQAYEPEEGKALFYQLLHETQKMLCAGVVHGDLSDFNVLISADGPVIIDFPQWVDPGNNRNARKLLIRDVDNLAQFLGRHAGSLRNKRFGQEMWDLFERGELTPETRLTGKVRKKKKADVGSLLEEFEALERESLARREALGLGPPRRARAPIVYEEVQARGPKPAPDDRADRSGKQKRKRKRKRKRGPKPAPEQAAKSDFDDLDALLSMDD